MFLSDSSKFSGVHMYVCIFIRFKLSSYSAIVLVVHPKRKNRCTLKKLMTYVEKTIYGPSFRIIKKTFLVCVGESQFSSLKVVPE